MLRDRDFAGFRVVSIPDDRDGHLIDDFLDKNHIPHRVVDVKSEQGQELTKRFHLKSRDLPTLITPTGSSLRRPSLREIAQVAGLLRPLARGDETEILSDVTIVGAGPAGLADRVRAATDIKLKEQTRLRQTADFKEGVNAVNERRVPRFVGR